MLDSPKKIKKFDELALERTEHLSDFAKNLLRITRLRLNKESELTDFSLKLKIQVSEFRLSDRGLFSKVSLK